MCALDLIVHALSLVIGALLFSLTFRSDSFYRFFLIQRSQKPSWGFVEITIINPGNELVLQPGRRPAV